MGFGHGDKLGTAFQTDGLMPHIGEGLQIPPWTATEIQDIERGRSGDVPQQGLDVLADIMILGSVPEIFGIPVIVTQCTGGDGS
jgi:hypothetical protein